jgi:hypothetical protein
MITLGILLRLYGEKVKVKVKVFRGASEAWGDKIGLFACKENQTT